jgi:DNA repair protein RecO (recombination protein O)
MKPRRYTTEAIVLARRDFSEADRILTIYTKNFGKLGILAKGIKKPQSRKRGHLEIFCKISFSAVSAKGLDIVTEAEIIDSYSQVRKDLKKVTVAYFFVEVANKITKEEEKNEDYYNLLSNYLDKLKVNSSLKQIRLDFVRETLVLLGFWASSVPLSDPDKKLEEIIERKLSSARVGKKILL